jgi:hypothetical protein
VNSELKGCRNKRLWPHPRQCPNLFAGIEGNYKKYQNSRFSGQDMNQGATEY